MACRSGIVFMGRHGAKRSCSVGYAFEQRSKARKPPKFLPTVTLKALAHVDESQASAMPVWTAADGDAVDGDDAGCGFDAADGPTTPRRPMTVCRRDRVTLVTPGAGWYAT